MDFTFIARRYKPKDVDSHKLPAIERYMAAMHMIYRQISEPLVFHVTCDDDVSKNLQPFIEYAIEIEGSEPDIVIVTTPNQNVADGALGDAYYLYHDRGGWHHIYKSQLNCRDALVYLENIKNDIAKLACNGYKC